MEGLAQFFMSCIVEHTERGYEIGYLVGVHESPVKVRNDGINLAGTIAILRHCADAATILGRETKFTHQYAEVATGLMATMDSLYNGRFFKASDDQDKINMSTLGPIYPMNVIPPMDSRAISTVEACVEHYKGTLIGHGNTKSGFPWSAGVLGAILAWQCQGDLAWEIIQDVRPTICNFGGMTEVMENGEWNMQYFGTAQGAVCIALHKTLIQSEADFIDLFPAIPSTWENAEFKNLLASGFSVSAKWMKSGNYECTVRNTSDIRLMRQVRCGGYEATIELDPGETRQMTWQA